MSPESSRITLLLAMFGALTVQGCILRAGGTVAVSTQPVFRHPPTLVLVGPGLWVVEDYERAVFFVDDSYWYWDDDVWYRSSDYSTGWVVARVDLVPQTVRVVDRRQYVRFRAPYGIERRQARAEAVRRDVPPGHDDPHDGGRGRAPDRDDDRDRGQRPGAAEAGGRVDEARGRDDNDRGRGHAADDSDPGRGGGVEADRADRSDDDRRREEEADRQNPGRGKGGGKPKGGKPKGGKPKG